MNPLKTSLRENSTGASNKSILIIPLDSPHTQKKKWEQKVKLRFYFFFSVISHSITQAVIKQMESRQKEDFGRH